MKPDSMEPIPAPALPNVDQAVGAAPVFGDKPTTKKPKAQSNVASFLSGAALPARENTGGKILTGQ